MEEKKYGDIGYVHKLDPDDVKMFEEIAKTSKSENEKHFFRIMEYRQKHHCSPEYDYLLDSEKNPDKVGFTENGMMNICCGLMAMKKWRPIHCLFS